MSETVHEGSESESGIEEAPERFIHAVPQEYAHGALVWFTRASRELAKASSPLLASIESTTMDDIPDHSVDSGRRGAGRETPDVKGTLFRYEWEISVEQPLDFDVEDFLTKLYEMSEAHGAQATKNILDHISAVSEEHGQVVEAGDRPFFEVLSESLEKLDFDFDENGNHGMRLVLHPDNMKLVQGLTEDQRSALDQIVERKRGEWNAKRRRKQLPRLPD
ncbi:hypothetical protein [Paenarthrobacter sp. A20]|uniref:hypothetical protein n=1 Tax=Paenarthrobacter sp. A20 TaxID=2817891 RepID=UPI00209DCFA4|nr:hypothetical protein [Paenarthrobacter sp. A20]MCP1413676.1 hypothetical protein [Paenarthrobacter sp. A20]